MMTIPPVLDQFKQHTACRRRMNECHETAARAHTRRIVDQTRALRLQPL
jgi:hypothetical protein